MSWSTHVPAGPCETFESRAKDAVAALHLEQRPHGCAAELAQAAKAIQVASTIVAEHMSGQQDTHYSASIGGHVGGGHESFNVSVSASPVPQEATQ